MENQNQSPRGVNADGRSSILGDTRDNVPIDNRQRRDGEWGENIRRYIKHGAVQ